MDLSEYYSKELSVAHVCRLRPERWRAPCRRCAAENPHGGDHRAPSSAGIPVPAARSGVDRGAQPLPTSPGGSTRRGPAGPSDLDNSPVLLRRRRRQYLQGRRAGAEGASWRSTSSHCAAATGTARCSSTLPMGTARSMFSFAGTPSSWPTGCALTRVFSGSAGRTGGYATAAGRVHRTRGSPSTAGTC